MAAKYLRRQTWWVRFYHPRTGTLVRGSLETRDPAKAELLRQRVELEAALLDPRFQAAEIPTGILEVVHSAERMAISPSPAQPVVTNVTPPVPQPGPAVAPRVKVKVEVALNGYLDFIRIENSPHHVAGKLSMMRRFFGSPHIDALTGQRAGKGRISPAVHAPFFAGSFLDEITPTGVLAFMDQLHVSKKTKRHYREFFHHFFEFCMKFGFYQPTNWHSPNPIAALPSYVSRNRRIVFLTQEQVAHQLEVLKDHPRLQMAVALMIYGGLRRAEMLWLTRDAFSAEAS